MKRILLCALLCLLATATLFAVDNHQKIYNPDSDIWQRISDIYVVTGHANPSATGPWSADELEQMMQRISRDEVPSYLQATYDSVLEELAEGPEVNGNAIGQSFDAYLNLELYAHTNTQGETRTDVSSYTEQLFVGRNNWASDVLKTTTPLIGFSWETFATDHFYSFFEMGLYNSFHGAKEIGETRLSSNIFLFQNFEVDAGLMDANMPFRAFVAMGGKNWSAQLGRERISWGLGKTGNLAISNTLPYHNVARFTTYSDRYKYTFLMSFFPNKMNYYNSYPGSSSMTSGYTYSGHNNGYGNRVDGLLMYISHRLEGRFFNDRLGLSLTEAVMYASETNHFDLAVFNPVMIFHNNYTAPNSNSTLIFEADYTPVKGLNVYGQFLVDEFAIPFIENQPGKDNPGSPNCYAFLFGATYKTGVADGLLSANAEFALINPYTYLRDADNAPGGSATNYNYGLDYVVSVRQWSTSLSASSPYGGITYDDYNLGYTYGPDSLVLNFNLDYKLDKLHLTLNFLDMMHGTHDLWTEWSRVGGCTQEEWDAGCTTPTTQHDSKNYRYDDAELAQRNSVWTVMDLGLGAAYEFSDKVEAFLQADYVIMKNAYNRLGHDDSDFQIVLGATYNF